MKMIVGLGNPGKKYEKTKHNVGFMVVDELAKEYQATFQKNPFEAEVATFFIDGEKIILVKPQTYMNLSGESIIQFKKFYKISNKNIIVIYDDIDLKIGDIRLKAKGGAGTHNGMKSVVQNLNTEDFIRVRVGIGSPENKEDMINYVIGPIPKREKEILEGSIEKAAESVIEILKSGIDVAMNRFN